MAENSSWQNLTDKQFVALVGLVEDPTDYEVDFPKESPLPINRVCVVRHFSGVEWRIEIDGTITQKLRELS